ncbi:MAG: pyruvate kinase [Clostridiales Family XIII bacterium]|jgi:pyruvate kinase|nr:pyruvate kinase [Clostridiales Family XIII bacterium]
MEARKETKRTKLICTIGPASDSPEMLGKLMKTGMNAARINFSHGTFPEHKAKMDLIKKLRGELGLPIAIMLDTKGPEIRTGSFEGGAAELVSGQSFTIFTDEIVGDSRQCSTSYAELVNDVSVGDRILIDDGLIGLGVQSVEADRVVCTVRNGGQVKDRKSINVPGVKVRLPAMSDSDRDDIEFGIREGVDFIAASFIRKAADVLEIRSFLDALGGQRIKIISKIENKEGVENIGEIIAASDGVMVARGDLGVEIPPEEVPLVQKEIIRSCNNAGKFVITATQMMDSMIRNPRPTRAEVADVANAILDGTDAVMLSGETASGKYPLEAVQMMRDVARTTEVALFSHSRLFRDRRSLVEGSVSGAISVATCSSADSLGAKAIVTPTSSGRTAQAISMNRPKTPIIAFSTEEIAVRQLSLVWGVTAFLLERFDDQQDFFRAVIRNCMEKGLASEGDIIVLTAGIPLGVSGNTNMLRIHEIGHAF